MTNTSMILSLIYSLYKEMDKEMDEIEEHQMEVEIEKQNMGSTSEEKMHQVTLRDTEEWSSKLKSW